MSTGARLSVVIVARSGPAAALACVDSLRADRRWAELEVILVNALGQQGTNALRKAGREVAVCAAQPQWRITRQRAAGVRMASADIVAVLNERYRVPPGWADAVLQRHAEDCDIVWGAIAPDDGMTLTGWAIYLCEYSHLLPPDGRDGLGVASAGMIPGGNVSYKRRLFACGGGMENARSEMEFHFALFAADARFRRESRMEAIFAAPGGVEYMAERFAESRDFAAAWAARAGAVRRYAAAAARIWLPCLIVFRVAAYVTASRRFRLRFLLSLPWILCFGIVQMIGEMWGYVGPQLSSNSEAIREPPL